MEITKRIWDSGQRMTDQVRTIKKQWLTEELDEIMEGEEHENEDSGTALEGPGLKLESLSASTCGGWKKRETVLPNMKIKDITELNDTILACAVIVRETQ